MDSVFGFLRRGGHEKSEASDALQQRSKGEWNDRLGEHRFHLRMAWSCAAGSMVIAGISIAGCIYLGTLPKSDVEYALFDAAGRPVKTDVSELITESERRSVEARLVKDFIRNVRETYPISKKRQEDAVLAAVMMTNPDTPAWKHGERLFEETKPYERRHKEAVTIEFGPTTVKDDKDWTIEFTETVRDNFTLAEKSEKWIARVTTEKRTDRESRKRTPLGLFVWDFDFAQVDGEF